MIKVLHVIPTLGIAGAETLLTNLAIATDKSQFMVEVLTLYSAKGTFLEKKLADNGIKITYLDKHLGIDFSMLTKLRKAIKGINPDIIHAHINTVLYMVPITKKYHGKILYTVHNLAQEEASGLHLRVQKYLTKKKHIRLIAISERVRESIQSVYGCDCVVINNGIETSKYHCDREYVSSNHIASVGRLMDSKNHKLAIEIIKILSSKTQNIKYNIYGEGELRQELQEMIDNYGLADNISLCGIVEDIPAVLATNDIFLLPSKYEGFGLVVAEAMASGMPVVSTINGGSENLIQDGVNGFLLEQNDKDLIENMAEKLHQLIINKELRCRMGNNALYSSKEFDIAIMSGKYQEEYIRASGE